MEDKIYTVVKDLRQPNLTEDQRNFLRHHELYHEAYTVARQINQSENKNSNGENNERY